MNRVFARWAIVFAAIVSVGIVASATQAGTVVRFEFNYSVSGDSGPIDYFEVELFDNEAPITVANFLRYVNDGLYDNTIIHRNVEGFVMQGGGFAPTVEGGNITGLQPITNYGPIQNEYSPSRSNVSGTIAMAKLGGDPNSASNQWFVNVGNNSADLDGQNGGFTVFGRVRGEGMTLVNAINSLPIHDYGGIFNQVPRFDNGSALVTITSAAVVPGTANFTGSLSGFVYVDVNRNGVMDGLDYAIADVQVSVMRAGSDAPLATVYTASDGSYQFAKLGPGTYSIKMQTTANLPGLENKDWQLVLDKDGTTIVNGGALGTSLPNAYSDIVLGNGQSGLNFNFAQSAYPVTLISARMLLNSSAGVQHTKATPIPGTNAATGSILGVGHVLVGASASTTLTVTNLGGLGSELFGTLPGAGGEFDSAGSVAFGPLGSGQEASQTYTYTPTARGSDTQDVTVVTTIGNVKLTVSGTGVAPVSSLTQDNVYVLVGNEGTASITIQNVGDGNLSNAGYSSNLNGDISDGSGSFSGSGGDFSLPDGELETFNYTYAPMVRGEESVVISASFENGRPDGTNSPHERAITLYGAAVAPVSSISQADAGVVLVNSEATASITIENIGDGNRSDAGDSSNLNGNISDGSGSFSGSGGDFSLPDGELQTFSYTYVPTARGEDSVAIWASFENGRPDDSNNPHEQTITLYGKAVAPQLEIDTGNAYAGLVRIGTTGTAGLTVNNIGDGNLSDQGEMSCLNGSIASGSGSFSGNDNTFSISDSAGEAYYYDYTPTGHAIDATTILLQFSNGSADGMNRPDSVNVELTGQGVGPVFFSDLPPGSTLDFGTVPQADSKSVWLNISNISIDPNGGNTELTDLTLFSIDITGIDGGLFSLVGFTPGTVLHQGDLLGLEILYNGTGEHGDRSATLTIFTDEDAAFGGSGGVFTYQISASLAPEPGSLVLLAIGGLFVGGLAWRRRAIRNG